MWRGLVNLYHKSSSSTDKCQINSWKILGAGSWSKFIFSNLNVVIDFKSDCKGFGGAGHGSTLQRVTINLEDNGVRANGSGIYSCSLRLSQIHFLEHIKWSIFVAQTSRASSILCLRQGFSFLWLWLPVSISIRTIGLFFSMLPKWILTPVDHSFFSEQVNRQGPTFSPIIYFI